MNISTPNVIDVFLAKNRMGPPSPTSEIDDVTLTHINVSQASPSVVHRVCKVCGAPATGNNFSVLTCESCKAFFRRNAKRSQELKCALSTDNCKLTPFSRRFCQACRLRKCFEVGMRADWISSPTMKAKRRHIDSLPKDIEEFDRILKEMGDGDISISKETLVELVKKTRQPVACQCTCTCGFYPIGTPLMAAGNSMQIPTQTESAPIMELQNPHSVKVTPSNGSHQITHQLYYSQLHLPLQQSQCPPSTALLPDTCKIPVSQTDQLYQQQELLNTTADSVTQQYTTYNKESQPVVILDGHTIGPQTNTMPHGDSYETQPNNVYVTVNDYSRFVNSTTRAMETQSAIIGLPKGLSTREQFLMHELIIVNARLKEPLEIEPSHKASEDFDLMDVLRIIDLALRRIINMAKELSAFKELMQADQIALLKGSSIELLILRGVMVYDPLRDVWNPRSIHGEKEMEIRLNVLKMSQRREHYEEHKKFLNTFDEKWRRNENVMLILSALTLFDADRPNVTHITKVRTFYAQYQDLLRRYLQLTCSPDESQRAMKLLLDKLVDVRHLNHGLLEVLYGLNLNEVDPLLLELFDLGKAPRLSADV